MFDATDCTILYARLEKQDPADSSQTLAKSLFELTNEASFVIKTLSDLFTFIIRFNESEIELLILYLIAEKPVFIDQFTDIETFHRFVSGETNGASFSSQIKLILFQQVLVRIMPSFIQDHSDVIRFIDLVHASLPQEHDRLNFFRVVTNEAVQALYRPSRLPADTKINQSYSRSEDEYSLVRQSIPSIYMPDYEPIEELLGDLFCEWSTLGSSPDNNLLAEKRLNIIATYEHARNQFIQTKNQFNTIKMPQINVKCHEIVLIDVDQTLIHQKNDNPADTEPRLIFNFELIEKLCSRERKDIYLFTDMPCVFKTILQRETLINVLRQAGMRVHGVLSPVDLIFDLCEDDLRTLAELSCGENPLESTLVAHPLTQAIYERFSSGNFPPTCGETYKNELKRSNIKMKDHAENGKKFIYRSEHLDPIEKMEKRKPSIIIRNRLMYALWETVRCIESFHAERTKRQPSHIKLHLVKQFLSHHPQHRKVYIYDDQSRVIESISAFMPQNEQATESTLRTVPVKFPSILDAISNHYPRFYQAEKVPTHSEETIPENLTAPMIGNP